MKTITLEVEDSYWLEISKLTKKFPIKIIEEKIAMPIHKYNKKRR